MKKYSIYGFIFDDKIIISSEDIFSELFVGRDFPHRTSGDLEKSRDISKYRTRFSARARTATAASVVLTRGLCLQKRYVGLKLNR